MKTSFLAVALLALLVLGARDLQAQAYGPYYYGPYWDQMHELHVMHYQLYLQQYQPYQIYQPCCYSLGVIVPGWSNSIGPRPQAVISPRSQATRRR